MVKYACKYVLCRSIFLPVRDELYSLSHIGGEGAGNELYNLSYPTSRSRSSRLACSVPVEIR